MHAQIPDTTVVHTVQCTVVMKIEYKIRKGELFVKDDLCPHKSEMWFHKIIKNQYFIELHKKEFTNHDTCDYMWCRWIKVIYCI